MNRRNFIAAVSVAATAAEALPAAEGGTPVRSTPLVPDFWGPEYYDATERSQVVEVLETGRPFRYYGRGKQAPEKVATFEKELAARMQTKYALAVTSGTAALQTALAALQIGPGDEVILPAWAWHSCYNTIVHAGALPVFAEIDESFDIDPADIEAKITQQTKLIMAVHLQGNPCDLDRILEIARKHNIRVLEDCAQSVGASYKGRPLGSMGEIGIYSFQIQKTISSGEGGAVVMNDPVLYERAVRFHDLGGLRAVHQSTIGESKVASFPGSNFRMNELSGGVMLAQVRKLDRIVSDIRANARHVYEGVKDLPGIRFRKRSDPAGELGTGIYIAFESKAQRDRFIALMKAENVPAQPPAGSVVLPLVSHIEQKITVHPAWPSFNSERGRAIRYGAACCPRTIAVLDRFAGPLIDPKFTPKDCDDAIAAIRKCYRAAKA